MVSNIPAPPQGWYGYRLYSGRSRDDSLGLVERFGSDFCFRAVGQPSAEWIKFADGSVVEYGNTEDAAFLVAFRSSECPVMPPDQRQTL